MKSLTLSADDQQQLQYLEAQLWVAETRFDSRHMDNLFAPDMFEIGRSGQTYGREQLIGTDNCTGNSVIDAKLPLENLAIRLLSEDIAQVTYNSHVRYDGIVQSARRSSIWSRSNGSWVLRFHQGTPYITDSQQDLSA